MDIDAWLRDLGLERYEQAFRDNEVTLRSLPHLTVDDLKEMGVTPIGHRRLLLQAITLLRESSATAVEPFFEQITPGQGVGAVPNRVPEAERRQLTVMFVDLVGSTVLSSELDPEDMRELISAYHSLAAASINRNGGFVAKYMGDGVLAYFGYPRAHEDDAEGAVQAGLEVVRAIRGLESAAGTPLHVRIGIATGLVVVGDLLGSGAAREQMVVGETPNLAARLQALAEPDSVVIAAATRRLVGDLFQCLDLGGVEVKGFAVPVRAYRVLGVGTAESRFEAFHPTPLAPLVGREEEMGLLLRRWQEARSGEGRVVLLSGEPGVGKSRMLVSLRERLGEERHVPVRYFCSPHHQDSALHPVTAQLERAAGFARGDPPEARLAKLEALLVPTSPTTEDVALLAELLSLPHGERYALPRLAPQRRRELTFEALLRLLERLSARGPLLMVFEDVHWIDPSSRALLDLVVERATGLALLLLITFRPEFEAPWIGRPHVMSLVLNRLGPQQGAALVRTLAGDAALPDDLVAAIVERTDGVPLFLEELTQTMLEAGATGLAAATPWAALAVPATLHDSLMARLDRLDPAAREAAQVGAVIGREFSHELLAAVAGFGEGELAAALDQLIGAGLVFRSVSGPDAGYLFKHALVRDAAYGTLLRDRRRQLHAGIARTLEERFPGLTETGPELIAHHLTEAGHAERAVRYWIDAGRRSAERSADREAVSHLRRGLEVLAGLPSSTERDRTELDFQLAIGTPLIALFGWSGPQVAAAYERAGALCESLGDDEHLITTLFGLASNRIVRGETRAAERLAEQCRVLTEHGRRPADRLLAHRAMGAALMQLGALREARVEFEQISALYDPQRDRSLAARCVTDPRASGLSFLAIVLWIMGYPEQAQRTAGGASRYAAELGHANTTGHILCHARGGTRPAAP